MYAITWMDLENMLNEIANKRLTCFFFFYSSHRKCPEQTNTQKQNVDYWLPGAGRKWEATTNRVSFGSDKNILKLIAQVREYTKNHRIICINWCVICEFYLKKELTYLKK